MKNNAKAFSTSPRGDWSTSFLQVVWRNLNLVTTPIPARGSAYIFSPALSGHNREQIKSDSLHSFWIIVGIAQTPLITLILHKNKVREFDQATYDK